MEYTLRLKEIRQEKRLRQEDAYEGICSQRHYSRIENNKSNISVYLLLEFATRLESSLDDMFCKTDLNKA